MSTKTVRFILAFMLLTIAALFVTQAYWFQKSFSLQERQLEDKINVALRNVADAVLKSNQDSITRIPPIEKLASNEFLVKTATQIRLEILDKALRKEFSERHLNFEFDYAIVDENNANVVLGNSVYEGIQNWQNIDYSQVACASREEQEAAMHFKILIHNKTTYLLNVMGIWLYSTMTLLLILTVFVFIMVAIIKGKKLSMLKKDFVNNMTHELKTPIANISVASDAIRSQKIQMDPPKLQKYADIIYKENDRLHQLVDKVLQISSIEKNDESISLELVDIHEVIKDVVGRFEAVLQQKNGIIQINLLAQNFCLMVDKLHMSNVIYNLIENAIKYADGKPIININSKNIKKSLILDVSDNGIGMTKESQERVFDKFYREASGNLHNTKGYGLGLSYVKLIVEKHKGMISFKSKQGEGSTFNIVLPI